MKRTRPLRAFHRLPRVRGSSQRDFGVRVADWRQRRFNVVYRGAKPDGMIVFEGHEVRVSGKRVALTALEFKLLNVLFTHPGRVFSREELLDLAWGQDTVVEHRTVDTHLRRLRQSLGPAARQIQTVRGFGYRLESE